MYYYLKAIKILKDTIPVICGRHPMDMGRLYATSYFQQTTPWIWTSHFFPINSCNSKDEAL
jgi:hypothetical protein